MLSTDIDSAVDNGICSFLLFLILLLFYFQCNPIPNMKYTASILVHISLCPSDRGKNRTRQQKRGSSVHSTSTVSVHCGT